MDSEPIQATALLNAISRIQEIQLSEQDFWELYRHRWVGIKTETYLAEAIEYFRLNVTMKDLEKQRDEIYHYELMRGLAEGRYSEVPGLTRRYPLP